VKLFISYGFGHDQVTALRLQALGAVNGLTIYVPPAFTRQGVQPLLDPDVAQKLGDAQVVLGVIGAGLSESCRHELNMGLALKKTMIVMTNPSFASDLQPTFGANLVVIDPFNPQASETAIVDRLKSMNAQQNATKALLALGTLTLGLLILASATTRD
jgi:hypothetical protein